MQLSRWISAAAIVFAGACFASAARADDVHSFESWTDFDHQYATAIDDVFDNQGNAQNGAQAQPQTAPSAIGGGPGATYEYEEVIRVYRTPSSNDTFWSDFHARYDQAVGAVQNAGGPKGFGGGPGASDEATPTWR